MIKSMAPISISLVGFKQQENSNITEGWQMAAILIFKMATICHQFLTLSLVIAGVSSPIIHLSLFISKHSNLEHCELKLGQNCVN